MGAGAGDCKPASLIHCKVCFGCKYMYIYSCTDIITFVVDIYALLIDVVNVNIFITVGKCCSVLFLIFGERVNFKFKNLSIKKYKKYRANCETKHTPPPSAI